MSGSRSQLRMTRVGFLAFLVIAVSLAPAAAQPSVVELPVSFEVLNVNRSVTTCPQVDGKAYTIRGSLVGPAGVETGMFDAVTLYIHGSGDASSWHFTAVPGVDHITEMAKLGHASVFIHSLGYGLSDDVDGTQVCFGSIADTIHQVIGQLREGGYIAAGADGPAFGRIAVAGHSGGALESELEAVSFHDADAYIFSGWGDYPVAPVLLDDPAGPFFYTSVAGFAVRCQTAPESKEPGGPSGWAHVFTTRDEFEVLISNAEPAVFDAFFERYEQDPCGLGQDVAATLAANIALAPTVTVPVLLPYGDREPFLLGSPIAAEQQRARYALGNDDVTVQIVADSGHLIMLERPAAVFRAGLSEWLRTRGF